MADGGANIKLGIFYAVLTTLLYSVQEPFSGQAARQLTSANYIAVTQLALLLAIPFMLVRRRSRQHFLDILFNPALYGKLTVLLALGVLALLCLFYGLSGANPIVISAVLNMSPFWAALVAKFVSRKPIPVSPIIFFACFLAAFLGAMLVAFSQNQGAPLRDILKGVGQATWIFALPIPLLSALNGTLIGEWFKDYDESAALAANFLLSVCVVVPIVGVVSLVSSKAGPAPATALALALLVVGTLLTAAVGRVTYQFALSATQNDNGFVSMFLLLTPALSALVTLPLSWLLPDLRFVANVEFLGGLLLIAGALLFFSIKAWRPQQSADAGQS